jgi:putative PIN family toxin of toxin-antitoxin system
MKIVVDTNVLVAGLLKPFGTCGEIVRMLASGDVSLCLDARILLEYDAVLRRPRFAIDSNKIDILLDFISRSGQLFGSSPLSISLPDPDDNPFLEVALAAGAESLVTGNLKHFPPKYRFGVRVHSPAEFIEFYRKQYAERS